MDEVRTVRLDAPAKVNLHLEILHREPDGYHQLLSLFQKISLYDHITVTRSAAECFSVRVVTQLDELGSRSTMHTSARLFCEAAGITDALLIECQKHIPVRAGLGGGSSDAAAVLMALDQLYGHPLDEKRLCELALRVGSDVPFFLSSEAAIVSGRGECIEPVTPRGFEDALILLPPFSSSTPEAYRSLDASREDPDQIRTPLLSSEDLRSVYESPVSRWRLFNSFSDPLILREGRYRRIMKEARACGYEFVQISGSGSAIIAISEQGGDRSSLTEALRHSDTQVIPIKMLVGRTKAVYN